MWTQPQATEMRFGFEVTMYVCNRQFFIKLEVVKDAEITDWFTQLLILIGCYVYQVLIFNFSLRRNIMWTKPAATEMRFGFEVTMYVMNK